MEDQSDCIQFDILGQIMKSSHSMKSKPFGVNGRQGDTTIYVEDYLIEKEVVYYGKKLSLIVTGDKPLCCGMICTDNTPETNDDCKEEYDKHWILHVINFIRILHDNKYYFYIINNDGDKQYSVREQYLRSFKTLFHNPHREVKTKIIDTQIYNRYTNKQKGEVAGGLCGALAWTIYHICCKCPVELLTYPIAETCLQRYIRQQLIAWEKITTHFNIRPNYGVYQLHKGNILPSLQAIHIQSHGPVKQQGI